ncbi:CRISPR-associated CARF protein Csa3 [Thermofilum pendens]
MFTGNTYIATLGFDATHVVRMVGEGGLRAGDEVVIVTSSNPHPRAENALKSVYDFVEKLNPKAKVTVLRLDERRVAENAALLARLLRDASRSGRRVTVDVSGGPRGLALSLYIASVLASTGEVYLTTETTGERVKVPLLPSPARGLTEKQVKALSALPCTTGQLAEKLGVSKGAASRLLRRLREKGLASTTRGKHECTDAGRMVAALYAEA